MAWKMLNHDLLSTVYRRCTDCIRENKMPYNYLESFEIGMTLFLIVLSFVYNHNGRKCVCFTKD